MAIAEQLRQEQRENNSLQKVKAEIVRIIKEKIHEGRHSIVISFDSYQKEGAVEECKYCCNYWWSVSEKHRIPLTEYLNNEGFVVKPGPLYCVNIEVSL